MTTPPRSPFSPERRRALLDEFNALQQRLRELRDRIAAASGGRATELVEEERVAWRRSSDLQDEYAAGVPVLPISRCPFTGQVMEHSVDHFGLDGLWWNYEAPARPLDRLPETYLALTGAVRLKGNPPWTPFLCKPGPEVPYVVPRLLQHPSVKAVLSSLPIGDQEGYAITYFALPIPRDISRINTWGTNEYQFRDENGELRWDSEPDAPWDMDFDLAPWISSGKLLWIAPGDATLTLRDAVDGCPYLGLDGRRGIVRIEEGNVW